jgi:hypothetical protein
MARWTNRHPRVVGHSARRSPRRSQASAELPGHHDLHVGWRLELLFQQHFVDPGVVQRSRAIARRHQGLHQPHRDPGVERVLRGKLPPPLGRLRGVAALAGPLRQALEGVRIVSRDPGPFLFHPALELGRLGDVKPVEKRADILGRSLLQTARLDGEREGGNIAGDEVGVEADVAGAEEDLVRADLLAQRVQGLVEPAPGPVFVALGPEHAEHPVAGHTVLPRGGQEGEQGKPARLRGGAAEALPVPLEKQPAERVQA